VHSSTFRGKQIPVKLSRRDDFPELWSPTTTSLVQLAGSAHEFKKMYVGMEMSHLRKRHVLPDVLFTKLVYLLQKCRTRQGGIVKRSVVHLAKTYGVVGMWAEEVFGLQINARRACVRSSLRHHK